MRCRQVAVKWTMQRLIQPLHFKNLCSSRRFFGSDEET